MPSDTPAGSQGHDVAPPSEGQPVEATQPAAQTQPPSEAPAPEAEVPDFGQQFAAKGGQLPRDIAERIEKGG
jgi:hypothetical protein